MMDDTQAVATRDKKHREKSVSLGQFKRVDSHARGARAHTVDGRDAAIGSQRFPCKRWLSGRRLGYEYWHNCWEGRVELWGNKEPCGNEVGAMQ